MFAQVAVKTKIPSIGKSYTYSIPEELKSIAVIGKIVEVPFGKTNSEGIILSIHDILPDFKVKDIVKIDPKEALLTLNGIALAEWMSWRYSANLYECISLLLPKESQKHIKENKSNIKKEELSKDLVLTEEQKLAFDSILLEIKGKRKPILIHGVTGSGKTELYLQTTREILNRGKQVIFMVPEISLTPQLIDRFSERFGEEIIAIVHSQISRSMRDKTWKEIQFGQKRIVIGSRSALLSPVNDLGAIIIDECHEQSYKQDKNPKYNAIELALYLSSKLKAQLILGSATPLIEQYYSAINGELKLITIEERISGQFPTTFVVDMKEERKNNNYSLLSLRLREQIKSSIIKSEQTMLYLNRRGLKSGIICTKCGSYETCPKCDMPLTIHLRNRVPMLVCHYCFYTRNIPYTCSSCGSKFLKGTGSGTQSIQEEVARDLPMAKTIVMDRDTTQKKGSHEEIFRKFSGGEANVLIGTQMITKGWDIAQTSLTGYLLLDSDLLFPSYRTSERVYQLITQFSGRSGRGIIPGINIIQTYNPNNPILTEALKQNYFGFYKKEIELREKLNYPPFVYLIQVTTKDKDETKALHELKKYISSIKKSLNERIGIDSFQMLGPSRSFISKINSEYFFQTTFKIKKDLEIFEEVLKIFNETKRNGSIHVNIDPFDLD